MTTIAYRAGVLAVDSRSSYNNNMYLHYPDTPKIWRSRRTGSVIACAGDFILAQMFKLWYEKGGDQKDKPVTKGDGYFYAVEVTTKGKLIEYDCNFFPARGPGTPFSAYGSGACVAMGAMEMGASAFEAIRAAAKHDASTGGRVRQMRPRKRKR